MDYKITTLEALQLVGVQTKMSLVANKTAQLWQKLMPRRKDIQHTINSNFYSIEIYPDLTYFENFSPTAVYTKWAALAVANHENIPRDLEALTIPSGDYAVFSYKGKASEAFQAYEYIFGTWLANSEYQLDDRPHFSIMGKKYIGESPKSEEELWIPIQKA